VLSREQYAAVLDTRLPDAHRRQAFDTRADWFRWLSGDYIRQMNRMVTEFGKLGIVERRPGPDDGAFPAHMYVESDVGF
jgi:hypothetical protein